MNDKKKEIALQKEEAEKNVEFRKLLKLGMLIEYYGIRADISPEHKILELCFCLCREKFPRGFTHEFIEKKAGRRRAWDSLKYSELIANIEKIKQEKKMCSEVKAIKVHLQRSGDKNPSDSKIRSLNARLVEARNPKLNIFYEQLAGDNPASSKRRLNNFIKYFSTEYKKASR